MATTSWQILAQLDRLHELAAETRADSEEDGNDIGAAERDAVDPDGRHRRTPRSHSG